MFRINYFMSGFALAVGITNFVEGNPLWGILMILIMLGSLVVGEVDYKVL